VKNLLLDTKFTCVIILFNISTHSIYGYYYKWYLYYISGYARYDIIPVEMIAKWYEVVQLSMEFFTVLPPSTVSREKPMPEGIIF
jgi:hypothetical protein